MISRTPQPSILCCPPFNVVTLCIILYLIYARVRPSQWIPFFLHIYYKRIFAFFFCLVVFLSNYHWKCYKYSLMYKQKQKKKPKFIFNTSTCLCLDDSIKIEVLSTSPKKIKTGQLKSKHNLLKYIFQYIIKVFFSNCLKAMMQ